MVGCSIRNCKNRSDKAGSIRFFSFPCKESVANEWLRYCGPKTTTKNGRVCSNHFLPSDYFKSLQHILLNESPRKVRALKPDVLPTLQIDDIDKQNTPRTSIKEISEFVGTSGNTTPSTVKKEISEIVLISGNTTLSTVKEEVTEIVGISGNNTVKKEISEIEGISGNTTPSKVKKEISENVGISDNTALANEVADSSKAVEKSDKNIMIPLAEYKLLKKNDDEYNVLKKNLKKMFTTGQVRCLLKAGKRRVKWSAEDIAAAIYLLRSISTKGYRHLRVTVGVPLPAFSTLRKWASKFKLEEGLLKNIVIKREIESQDVNALENF